MGGGDQRFEIEEQLGAGAMGVVYRAHDRERGTNVALKLLRHFDAHAIYRFKQEFRALADVTHPNLVTLHELVEQGDDWFFTMELVQGATFLEYVAAHELAAAATVDDARTIPDAQVPTCDDSSAGFTADTAVMPVRPSAVAAERTGGEAMMYRPGPPPSDERVARLRTALRQLAQGLCAIHDAGRLHRDIKPSNVMVTEEHRVVILDFGVATELTRRDATADTRRLVGTPAYMAPEQGAGVDVSPASDWYAVGVMLHEALTGVRPFVGSAEYVLASKQTTDAHRPSRVAPGVPDDLDDLCADLLARDPALRPTGAEVLARLGVVHGRAQAGVASRVPGVDVRLVGRRAQLLVLHEAFEAVRRGEQRTAFVHGASGVGKTALVGHFLTQVEHAGALVLAGRCYERESVRYKALDSLIDSLTRHLVTLPDAAVASVMPDDAQVMTRLFPVLRRVDRVVHGFAEPLKDYEPRILRRRAFDALRELMARLARRAPLVLYVDDVQWGDSDSAELVEHLLRGPNAPAVLFIASYRREDAESSEFLSALRPAQQAAIVLAVDPLSPAEANELALSLLGADGPVARGLAAKVARESRGNPLLVAELCRFLRQSEESGVHVSLGADPSLEHMLWRRLDRLGAESRSILEVVAVAARPVSQAVAVRAAGAVGDAAAAITALRNGNLVRTRGARDADDIECFHDRIRDVLVASLAEDVLQDVHRRLGTTLADTPGADPERLWEHFERAGEPARAAHYALEAAALAAEVLAFDRAARLYRRAIDAGIAATDGVRVRRLLADALANAGRRSEAAEVYQDAALFAEPADALELRRLCAESYLLSGHMDEGVRALRNVLETVGLDLPSSPKRAVLSLLIRRIWLRLRGTGFRTRDQTKVPLVARRRIETCWTAAIGFALCEPMRGASFQSRHLLYSLRSGDPHHIARSLALEAAYQSTSGARGQTRAGNIAARAMTLAEDIGDAPELTGWAAGARGLIAYQMGLWRETRDKCRQALVSIGDRGGAPWERTPLLMYELWSLFYLGELRELADRTPRHLRDAESNGDLISASCLSSGLTNAAWLVGDHVDEARRVVKEAAARWARQDFHLQHWWHLLAQQQLEFYVGDGPAAWRRLEASWQGLQRSLILRIPVIGFSALHLRGRSALAAAQMTTQRDALLKIAERDARKMTSYAFEGARALSLLQCAGVANLRGDQDAAVALLAESESALSAADMPLHAAAAQRFRGRAIAGSQGAALVAEADQWFRAQGVASPERFAAVVVSGFEARSPRIA